MAETCCETPDLLQTIRTRLLDGEHLHAVAETFKLLGDPTRVRILDALTHGERCVCDLASLVGISESAMSHQLRVLRSARLVRARREGRQQFYALDDHHVVGLLHDVRRHVAEPSEPANPRTGELVNPRSGEPAHPRTSEPANPRPADRGPGTVSV